MMWNSESALEIPQVMVGFQVWWVNAMKPAYCQGLGRVVYCHKAQQFLYIQAMMQKLCFNFVSCMKVSENNEGWYVYTFQNQYLILTFMNSNIHATVTDWLKKSILLLKQYKL